MHHVVAVNARVRFPVVTLFFATCTCTCLYNVFPLKTQRPTGSWADRGGSEAPAQSRDRSTRPDSGRNLGCGLPRGDPTRMSLVPHSEDVFCAGFLHKAPPMQSLNACVGRGGAGAAGAPRHPRRPPAPHPSPTARSPWGSRGGRDPGVPGLHGRPQRALEAAEAAGQRRSFSS